jgi:choline transporter-like protein 2/4/5
MEAASCFIGDNKRVIALPVVAYIVCIPLIGYWMYSTIYVYSIGEVKFVEGEFFATIVLEDQTRYLLWYLLFGLLWGLFFFICLQQFMIAALVCMWYFTGQGADMSDQPGSVSVLRAFKWGIWNHCGSIAFGSFLIALITFIRIVFEYLAKQAETANKENPVFKVVVCYIRYILWCLDKYVKFITKNAFIQIALQSKNFCSAAWGAFFLIFRNAGRFGASGIIGMIMEVLGKGVIMGLSTYLTFLIVQTGYPEVQQPFIPAILVAIVAYFVGSLFLSIFSFASTAILHCFILDEDTGGAKFTPDSL